ncbi:DUF4258 domain-containing protein [Thiohalocapsa sp. ML1]|uniref:DUF4258 domain-containing protein n=1 Tax=Thiohalocapsa sp. ML1 TaxID=1431688 RepID=UPI0009EBD4DE
MYCTGISFSGHAVRKMFERRISRDAVLMVTAFGEVIAGYSDDRPYPSAPLLGLPGGRPLHVVVARNRVDGTCTVVTAYRPDPTLWSDDFRTRRR